MQPEAKKLIADALEAATSIQQFVEGRSFDEIGRDKVLRSAIYWQFAIAGEAIAQLRRLDEGAFDRITESARIVAFRNQILHGYQRIQDTVTWQIIEDKLPVLRIELEQLLAE